MRSTIGTNFERVRSGSVGALGGAENRPVAKRAKRALVVLTAAAVALSGVASGSFSVQGASVADLGASLAWPNVGNEDGTELAAVSFVAADGSALEEAVVVASLWPSYEAEEAMSVGDSFRLVPVDRVPVEGEPAVIHVADSNLLASHRSTDRTVILQLDLFTVAGWTVFFLQRAQDDNGRWRDPDALVRPPEDPFAPVTFDLRGRALDPAPVLGTAADPVEPIATPELGLCPAGVCPWQSPLPLVTRHHQYLHNCSDWSYLGYSSVPETVVTSAVTNGITADVNYTTEASTTSSIGLTVDQGSKWEISGSSTQKSTLAADFDTVTGASGTWSNKEWRMSWAHKKFYRHCPKWPGNPDSPYYVQRMSQPYKAVGGPPIIDSRYPIPQCTYRHGLESFGGISTKDHTAMGYQAAFSLTWGPGTFKGTARSGYSTDVKVTFKRPGTGYWYWCGDDYVPQDSYKVRAGR
ncbi:MAG: hypothetical protein H0U17_00970 [Actinobacteria bacterium]|nr:hypothetical protein [Actinomycetota bacterium]